MLERVYQVYLPVFYWLKEMRRRTRERGGPSLIGMQCLQGGGKTTLCDALELLARSEGRNHISPISHVFPLYLPNVSPISPLYLPYISPISPPYLPYISPKSPLHPPYISPMSLPNLPYISIGLNCVVASVDDFYKTHAELLSLAQVRIRGRGRRRVGVGVGVGVGVELGLG